MIKDFMDVEIKEGDKVIIIFGLGFRKSIIEKLINPHQAKIEGLKYPVHINNILKFEYE